MCFTGITEIREYSAQFYTEAVILLYTKKYYHKRKLIFSLCQDNHLTFPFHCQFTVGRGGGAGGSAVHVVDTKLILQGFTLVTSQKLVNCFCTQLFFIYWLFSSRVKEVMCLVFQFNLISLISCLPPIPLSFCFSGTISLQDNLPREVVETPLPKALKRKLGRALAGD